MCRWVISAPSPGSVAGVYLVSTGGNIPSPDFCDHWLSSTPPPSLSKRRVGAIEKSAEPKQGRPGADVAYTLKVRNLGPDAAKGTVVSDPLPAGLSFVSADQKFVVPPTETISIDLVCSNRNLASRLKVGDVSLATSSSPRSLATIRSSSRFTIN